MRCDMKETDDIVRKKGDLIGRVNKVLVEFSKAPDSVVGGLFNSKCAHLYGCEAWDQGDPCVDKFYTTWNRSVRKLYGLPYTTHTRFLAEFVHRPHVKTQVLRRFYKLFQNMLQSENKHVCFLANMMKEDARSIMGRNIRVISRIYGIDLGKLKAGHCVHFNVVLDDADDITVKTIMELREVLKGKTVVQGFNDEDINNIMVSLCCD
jgi:hypothetical protein